MRREAMMSIHRRTVTRQGGVAGRLGGKGGRKGERKDNVAKKRRNGDKKRRFRGQGIMNSINNKTEKPR